MTHPDAPGTGGGTHEAALADVRTLLTSAGAPAHLAPPVLAALGPDAAAGLRADPWLLLSVPGIGPQAADLLARGVLGDVTPGDPRRAAAVLAWVLRRAAAAGHTVMEASRAVEALRELSVPDADAALRALVDEGRVMAFADPPPGAAGGPGPGPGEGFDEKFDEEFDDGPDLPDDELATGHIVVALDRYALAEEAVADAVLRLMSTAEPVEALDSFARARAGEEIADLDTSGLARATAATGVALYVCGPGEDPPVAPLRVAGAAAAAGLRTCVVAPTADGAARTGVPDGVPVLTVRQLLMGMHPDVPAPDPSGTLPLDLVVVTEAHLLDAEAGAALTEALADGSRLVLAGDPAELGPPGPGRVFADLMDCGRLPVILSGSGASGVIGELAAAVREGELPPVGSPDRQVVLVAAATDEEAAHRAAQLVGDSIPRVLGIAADDVLVVTPGDDGPAGTVALNAALKARLNPGPGRHDGFDVGDRVVRVPAVRGVGLVAGVVTGATEDGLRVAFAAGPEGSGETVVPRARLRELRHGWAVTVRQAQGVRRAGAVAVIPGGGGGRGAGGRTGGGAVVPTRSLIYTAFTRGTRHLSVVHVAGSDIQVAVRDRTGTPRTTRLVAAVRAAFDGG